jgi:RHS repeat-associated protein
MVLRLSQINTRERFNFSQNWTASSSLDVRYKFTGKERDAETGLDYFGTRYYDSDLSIWLSVDPMADKYPSLSPYHYAAHNPIKYIDVNGDRLWIRFYAGFLRWRTVLYVDGTIYIKKGTPYTGKMTPFLTQCLEALKTISSTELGKSTISELQSSSNNFIIVKSKRSSFDEEDIEKARAKAKGNGLVGGSGGYISWNPSGEEVPTTSGLRVDPEVDLAHEMFHALDANRGLLDNSREQDLKRSEWQAVYRENILREQLGKPLRTYYIVNWRGKGKGPYMLTPDNKPKKPYWYEN